MKIPKTPPRFSDLFNEIIANTDRRNIVFQTLSDLLPETKYLHWDKLRYYSAPAGLSTEEWWLAIKLARRNLYRKIPLLDKKAVPFNHLTTEPIPEYLHLIDQGAGGMIQMPEQITNHETRDQYYISSLIQEAITSSQLEGATTTRRIAKDMIKSNRPPRDRSERMILNNYRTMRHIQKLKDKPLTKEMVFEIHNLVTEHTLDDPSATGRLRNPDEKVAVYDVYNEVLHDPPLAEQLEERLAKMCDFANSITPKEFIHPVVRSIILHFWLSYDHPFVDGNGRTARALFYWSMLNHGFWLFEFISISQIILNAPAKYGRAFLYTETDDNDLTYFIIYHLEVIMQAIKKLHEHIKRKTNELAKIESQLRGTILFNHRQRDLIGHALRHPNFQYTIISHQRSHNVVYETARGDLMDLEQNGFLSSSKVGRRLLFRPVPDMEAKLASLNPDFPSKP